jgi:hypothetical protein
LDTPSSSTAAKPSDADIDPLILIRCTGIAWSDVEATILFLVLTAVLSSIFYVIINITGTLTLWVFGLM